MSNKLILLILFIWIMMGIVTTEFAYLYGEANGKIEALNDIKSGPITVVKGDTIYVYTEVCTEK